MTTYSAHCEPDVRGKNALGAFPEGPPTTLQFRSLYDEHFAYVWRCLGRFGVQDSDLMDATQNVFLVVYRRIDEFEGRSSFRTWLFGICRRVAADMRRSVRAAPVASDPDELTRYGGGASIPASATESHVNARHAQAIIDKLPEVQQVVFLMFELEEMSCDDISDALNIPPGTVRSRLRRAREFFKKESDRLTLIETNREIVPT